MIEKYSFSLFVLFLLFLLEMGNWEMELVLVRSLHRSTVALVLGVFNMLCLLPIDTYATTDILIESF